MKDSIVPGLIFYLQNGAAAGNRTREPLPYQGSALPTELQRHPNSSNALNRTRLIPAYSDTNSLKSQSSEIHRPSNWKPGKNGAGEGNRTLVISLEGWSFTTKLHPLKLPGIHLRKPLKIRSQDHLNLQMRIWWAGVDSNH